jgi:hypothetical protein
MARASSPRRITPDDVDALVAQLQGELRRFAIVYKDESRLQRAIAVLVWPFNRHYLTRYTTVMFGRIYFPSRAWQKRVGPTTIYETIRHEAVHLRDARRFPLIFQLTYLFVLPTVLTMRAVWEWRAYAETIRVHQEIYGDVPDRLLERILTRFTGADYLYMCPFPRFVRRRLEALRESLRRER